MSVSRILILDQDMSSANYLAAEFKKLGFEVSLAQAGKDGLITAWRHRPHLIILDPVFTDITLAEYLERLRKDGRTAKTKLIAFSSLRDPSAVQAVIKLGFDYYIAKESNALPVLFEKAQESVAERRASSAGRQKAGYTRQVKTTAKKGKLLVFLSAKGGVGTSSVCANLASMRQFYEKEAKIAVVDLVLPMGSIASIVGYDGNLNIVEASIMDEAEATTEYLRSSLPLIENWNFQLLAGSPDPDQAQAVDISRIPVLLNKLRQAFDYVYVDLGQSLSRISLPIILSADQIVLLLSLDPPTVNLTHKTLEFLRAKGLKRHQLFPLINRVVSVEGLSKLEVEDLLGLVMNSAIPHIGANFSLASNLHMPVFTKFPDDIVTVSLREISSGITKSMQKAEEDFSF